MVLWVAPLLPLAQTLRLLGYSYALVPLAALYVAVASFAVSPFLSALPLWGAAGASPLLRRCCRSLPLCVAAVLRCYGCFMGAAVNCRCCRFLRSRRWHSRCFAPLAPLTVALWMA
jgi:hypothetical protein